MKIIFMIVAMSFVILVPYAQASVPGVAVAEVGIDLHDAWTFRSRSPFEVWRKLRPQDFSGAPNHWQLFA